MMPTELRRISCIEWGDFEHMVERGFLEFINRSLDAGDALILKGALSEAFVQEMKGRVNQWWSERPSEFHKILDGVPDFHRIIDEKVSDLYSIRAIKHSAYFFRWNGDPLRLFPTITERWRVIKQAVGLKPDEYEYNLPSDGPTDRIQVVRYPPGKGFLEPHRDAFANQKCFISGYMSKRGVDYVGGGFYFLKDGEKVFAEDMIDVGDLCIGHANLLHGVDPCVGECDWKKDDGRWFLGLYSNDSDYKTNRVTSVKAA